jgi:hypothetical protein
MKEAYRLCELCVSVVKRIRRFHRGGAEYAEVLIEKYFTLCELCVSAVNRFGFLTAGALRARRKEFSIKKYSELCELRVSAVNKGRIYHR